ncbi:IclR family transcriptional regulator [Nocardioides gilvus]|uniref:IclR family transcriptional regulator n=1 Tax=Nocardioides gilvus TaxID=1735589 RepID=UPI000D74525C|nr:IclR family transcriptional regulator [Nocardioides gilvus]
MPSSENAPRVSGASSSRKLLNTLLLFTEEQPTWSVAELAAELGLSTTSTYRYVGLLREVGLLDSAPHNTYRVTDLVFGLSRACEAAQAPLAEVALPEMTRLRDEIGETVLIARRGGTSAYCVDRVESQRPVRLQFDRGQAMDLHAGSLSRILLSAMPIAERRRYVDSISPGLSPERLQLLTPAALDVTRAEGWTQSFEEVDEGIWGCAAAIRVGDSVVAAIGTAAPVFRTDDALRATIIEKVRTVGQRISAALS